MAREKVLAADNDPKLENARLIHELAAQQQQLERLLSRMLQVQEEERKRVSVEIHDSVAQWMAAALLRVQTCKTLLDRSKYPEARSEIVQAKETVEHSLKELRRIVVGLHPPLLRQGGLATALRQSLGEFETETGISCTFSCPEGVGRLSAHRELALFRIAQEALNNVRKHAQASHVSVRLMAVPPGLRLEVEDDGVGFDPSLGSEGSGELIHIGLLGMRERAEMMGGSLEVASSPGQGARVGVTIPLTGRGSHGS